MNESLMKKIIDIFPSVFLTDGHVGIRLGDEMG
jgi:hypothetical protein